LQKTGDIIKPKHSSADLAHSPRSHAPSFLAKPREAQAFRSDQLREKIFEKASKGERLRVVNDQFGQPTWTKDLAQQVLAFAELGGAPEIVHAVSSGITTWLEFAQEIIGDYPIDPVSSSEFVTPAKRPSYSVLDNSSDQVQPIGDWRERWTLARPSLLGSK
jgi:dTDP-4-dehydrorhamnose reductase